MEIDLGLEVDDNANILHYGGDVRNLLGGLPVRPASQQPSKSPAKTSTLDLPISRFYFQLLAT
jgi:hypothetical protein